MSLVNNTIYVSGRLLYDTPILVVDFDIENVESEYERQANQIIQNLSWHQKRTLCPVYITTCAVPIKQMQEIDHMVCPSWWGYDNEQLWRNEAGNFLPHESVQICGMFRELCMMEVANRLLAAGIRPIIVANDKCSISAKESVMCGDTLENRAHELDRELKYMNYVASLMRPLKNRIVDINDL